MFCILCSLVDSSYGYTTQAEISVPSARERAKIIKPMPVTRDIHDYDSTTSYRRRRGRCPFVRPISVSTTLCSKSDNSGDSTTDQPFDLA